MGNDFNSLTCSAWSGLGANYPIADDRMTSFWNEFGSGAVPRNVIIDMEGVVRYNTTGFNETQITNIVNQLLAASDTDPEPQQPESQLLVSNYPNPFNAGTSIEFQIQNPEVVKVQVLDVQGTVVYDLFSGQLNEGVHRFSWQGVDQEGQHLPGGVYMARVQTSSQSATRKLLMLK